MSRLPFPWSLLVAATAVALIGLSATLGLDVGRPAPGFFFTPDHRVVVPSATARDAGIRPGDRIVSVEGGSPLALMEVVRRASGSVRYDVVRGAGERVAGTLAPVTFTPGDLVQHFGVYVLVSAVMLAVGIFVYVQNPPARPNRNFLLYMCLWSVSNLVTPEAAIGFRKYSAVVIGFVAVLLSVHGWVFFLTYPVNPSRQAWLDRHRVIPVLYRAAITTAMLATLFFAATYLFAPQLLVELFPIAGTFLASLAVVSFPIKIWALLDTRRRAASPLVDQQTTVLLLGIGLGLGSWLVLMLGQLLGVYELPVGPGIGSALTLLYPLAIAYATVRYRMFDASVVIRRSMAYTALAALVAGAYALAIAGANVLIAHADLARSPWFSAAFMFAVALAFHPMREWMQRNVDRTFFRERQDHVRTIQRLARSMTSMLDLEHITRRLTTTVEASMHVRGVRLSVGVPSGPLGNVMQAARGALSRYQVSADPTFAAVAPAALRAYEEMDAEVIVPLRFQDTVHGVLVLGPKRSDAPYTAEDLELLETLADQTAVGVANAEAHRQVVDYARELERNLLIRTTLAKFVPQRVRELIEESPDASLLAKRETDVTVLFADITGYTRLSARLDAGALDAMVGRYFGAFLDEIVKHGGDVNETAGDGLMAIFHEGDHAHAALEAALAIHQRADELNAVLADTVEPVRMHIGVNSGPAALGATKIEGRGGTRWTYTASGLTTNVAARLAAVAQGGETVISDSTLARVRPAFDVEDLGYRDLKNVERAVRLYRMR
jgi:class 3 adenylate cyclase